MIVGTLMAIGNGVGMPIYSILFGQMANSFGNNAQGQEVLENLAKNAKYFAIFGATQFFCSFFSLSC